MKYIDKGSHLEMTPETQEDINYLRHEYPHLWPFKSVNVVLKPQERTPTGRIPKPFNPEPHRPSRRRGLTMALVRVGGGDPHWVDTVKLGLLNFLFLYSAIEQTSEGAVYTPVRFITFDQGPDHANP